MGVGLPAKRAIPPGHRAGARGWRAGVRGAVLASLGLAAASCGDLLPVVELGSTTTSGTTAASATTGVDTSGPGGPSTGTSADGTTGQTTTLADSDSSTGSLRPACNNGLVEPGEVCYGEPQELADFGNSPCVLDIGDVLYEDGDPELLVALCNQTILRIFPGGPAGLDMPLNRELGVAISAPSIRSIALGDYSGEGRLDVAVPDALPQVVIFTDLEQNPIADYGIAPASASYQHLLAGSFGGDANVDLLAGSANFQGFVVFHGTGDIADPLTLVQMLDPSQLVYDARISDLDLDGATDLVLAHIAPPFRLEVFAGSLTGFSNVPQFVSVPEQVYGLTTGQFDGEPGLDVMTSEYDATAVTVYPLAGSVTLGQGEVVPAGPWNPRILTTIDLDGDEFDDLVMAQAMGDDAYLVLSTNAGGGSFEPQRMILLETPEGLPDPVKFQRVADLNRDGVDDIVVATLSSRVLELLSTP